MLHSKEASWIFMLKCLCWSLGGVFLLCSIILASNSSTGYHYKEPIVFCRTERNPKTGKVLFTSKIWIMESDGSHPRQLTTGTDYDDHPSLYSDLEHVLFSEMPVNKFDPAAGARLIRLDIYTGTKHVYAEVPGCALHHATLSPINNILVYHRDCGKRRSLWVGWGQGSYEVNTVATNGVGLPGGVVFMQEKNRGYSPREVSIARLYGHDRGSKLVFLTDDRCDNRRPAISPDGKLLAWQTNMIINGGKEHCAPNENDRIFLANIDGSNAHAITSSNGRDGHPWFSRDGKWIVFESNRIGRWEIWKVNLATRQLIQLTHGDRRYDSRRPRM